MGTMPDENLLVRIEELEDQLAESVQLIEAIKAGEVDAFAVNLHDHSEVFTLQSGDYAYRLLIEEFGEGAVNLTDSGLIVYTNSYFSNLIGTPYEKIIGSNFVEFVHEDSLKKFDGLFSQAHSGKSKGEIELRFNNGTIPVYISLTSLQPKLPTIGIIITDLTEKKKNEDIIIKYQKDLEIKNKELEERNKELASFSYVSSHDLKEPLRKIQIFASRILEKEYEDFSVDTKENFNRILSAAKRMENLIMSLLNYSKATTSQILYSKTDLNEILREVKNNLSENIEENHVVIESEVLPTIEVVRDQFNQLFSNIISNSIKYKRTDVDSVIKISTAIVSAKEMGMDPISIPGDYLEISFTDNGIGFDQKFAEKIFDLFQRLHSKSEYEGTGIGLAICKKIIQNHKGFISAKGKPGAGTTISIYLPSQING